MLQGDPQLSLDFLIWARPNGPWVLTAIPPEGGRTATETFALGEDARLKKWLADKMGRLNLYWMVNPAMTALTSKASKEDVEAMEFLHVDVDPRKGHDLASERARALSALEAFDPPPSAIIDSGGGYQGFWRLDEPVYVGGDLDRIGELEAYNQQLEVVLGGDHCFNIDRIMRLPGTINVPDQKKRDRGRTEALATVVAVAPEGERVYPLSDFTAAPRVQSSGPTTAASVKLSGNLQPVLIDELPETVSLRTRALIVQGSDPNDPTKYGSRSEVMWAVTCELIRAGCDDDTIASILLDKDYLVSAHVLNQRRPVEYVARQIQRAKEEVIDPLLRQLNEAHAVIADIGGKCRVISEIMDAGLPIPRLRVSKQSFEDFRNRYMHQKVQVGTTKDGSPVYKSAGKWWLEHPLRRQYDTMVFAPNREVVNAYNLWKGFNCEAIPGDNHNLFLEHIRDNICAGNEEHYRYVVNWMARCVQRPGEPGEVAIVLRGGQGTGKGTFINGFGSLWGRHFLQVSNAKHLVGQFNAHLRDCVVLFGDEAFFAGDKQHESVLKTLITEDTLVVEGKGVDAEVAANCTHLLMSSNGRWVVPAGNDERRFLVLDVGEGQKQNTAYFAKVRKAMNNRGRENLLHFLRTLDIGDFDVRRVPQTEALREQKLFSLSLEEQWWLERLMDGRTTHQSKDWEPSITKEKIQADYLRYAEAQRLMRRVSPTALGKFLNSVMPGEFPVSIQKMTDVLRTDGRGIEYRSRERAYWYEIPALEVCRASWEVKYGAHWNWPEPGEDDPETETPELSSNDDPY